MAKATGFKYPSFFRRLRFGTSGIPPEVRGLGYFAALKLLHSKGLHALELEFVHHIHLHEDTAMLLGKLASKLGISISAHAPYYINLASLEKPKFHASINRIIKTCVITKKAQGHSVVFHAGFYQGRDSKDVYSDIAKAIERIQGELIKQDVVIWLRPETTGKQTQFGNLKELIRLSQEFEMVLPCVDFSHLHARSVGDFNSVREWEEVMEELRSEIPKEKRILNRMHIHISGIEYGKKGERRHIPLELAKLKYHQLIEVLKKYKVCGTVICEAPASVLISDTLKLKKAYGDVHSK